MLPFRKILCPTDFSEPSYKALDVAVELASQFSATLSLVYVVPQVPRPDWGLSPYADQAKLGLEVSEYEETVHLSAQQKLHELIVDRIPAALSGRGIVSDGEVSTQIVRIATEELADLIVIATKGQAGLAHVITGSVAEKVVLLATCPVLTIHGSGTP